MADPGASHSHHDALGFGLAIPRGLLKPWPSVPTRDITVAICSTGDRMMVPTAGTESMGGAPAE